MNKQCAHSHIHQKFRETRIMPRPPSTDQSNPCELVEPNHDGATIAAPSKFSQSVHCVLNNQIAKDRTRRRKHFSYAVAHPTRANINNARRDSQSHVAIRTSKLSIPLVIDIQFTNIQLSIYDILVPSTLIAARIKSCDPGIANKK